MNKTLKSVLQLAVILAVALVVLVVYSRYFLKPNAEARPVVATVASGMAKRIIPWQDRAEAQTKKLLEGQSGQNLANTVQNVAHPTGHDPKLSSYRYLRVGDQASVTIDVAWKGGITSHDYTTRVVWEFDKAKHIGASVTDDNAPTKTDAANLKKLNDYFRTECYAVLRSNMGD